MHLHRFRPLHAHALAANLCLLLFLAALGSHAALYATRLAQGADAAAVTPAAVAVGWLVRWALLATAIAFVAWFHRSYHNLRALGHRPRYAAGWAIGGWFVPLLQFVRPMQIARELWGATGAQDVASHGRVAAWWAATLLGAFAAGLLAGHWPLPPTGRHAVAGAGFGLAADLLLIGGALLAVGIVRRVSTAQHAAHAPAAPGGLAAAGAT
ncbi:MAG: DUF4328 domain-containing protein [Planctomycetes bacterium]|nr:DUF4328 domain-containing protein [Planctomycetota bacterium]